MEVIATTSCDYLRMELSYAHSLLKYKDRVLYLVYRKVFGKAYHSHYVNTIMRMARNPVLNVSSVISSISFSLSDVPGTTSSTISRVLHLFLDYIQNLHEGKLSESALKDISLSSVNKVQTSNQNAIIVIDNQSATSTNSSSVDVNASVCPTIPTESAPQTHETSLTLNANIAENDASTISSVQVDSSGSSMQEDLSSTSSITPSVKKKKKKQKVSAEIGNDMKDKLHNVLIDNPEPVVDFKMTVEPKVVEVANERTVLSRTSSKRRNTKELTLSSSSSGVLDLSPTGKGEKVKISNSQGVGSSPRSNDLEGPRQSEDIPVLSPAELLFVQLVGETLLSSSALGGRLRARYLDRAKQFGLTERLSVDDVPDIFNKLRISYEDLSLKYCSSAVFAHCRDRKSD